MPRSKAELTVIQQLAMTVYLNIYKDLIDVITPSMGLVKLDATTVRAVFDRMVSVDYVVDITEAIPKDMQRASVRSYISSASNSDRHVLLAELKEVILDPRTPPYFRGFREELIAYIVGVVGRKRWHMGDMLAQPTIHPDELGNNIILSTLKITLRLRDN